MAYAMEILSQPKLDRILKQVREALEALYGERLKGLYLFGSYARGEAEPESDLDIAVLLDGNVDAVAEIDQTGDLLYELQLEESIVLSLMFVSAEDFRKRWTPFLANLRREGLTV